MAEAGRHAFAAEGISACVTAQGAELCGLNDAAGTEYLWDAGAAWPRHAPVLFPIVGRLRDDALLHEGQAYRMTQHGFARDRRFEWVERTAAGCVLALSDDAETRAMYPFGFRFEIRYAVTAGSLAVTYQVENTGEGVLPASMGAHPAFRWPLEAGRPKEDYALTFAAPEPGPMHGVVGGLLTAADRASPVVGRRLDLREALFASDALIFPAPASRAVRYGAETGPGLTVEWEGFPQLGIWSRAGGDFLCIEPWCGMASPVGFSGEFRDKPWLLLIPPGERRVAQYRVRLGV